MSNYGYKQQSKSNIIKYVVAIILILALSGAVVAVALSLSGVFDQSPAPDTVTDEPQSGNDGLVVEPGVGNLLKLSAATVDTEDDDAVRLSVSFQPDNVSDRSCIWEIAFSDMTSDWARGKVLTDYVTVTPVAGDTSQADVRALQGFGEQVIITVHAKVNPSATANCTVDFKRRVESVDFAFEAIRDGSSLGDINVVANYVDEAYTIDTTLSDYKLSYDIQLIRWFGSSFGNMVPSYQKCATMDSPHGVSFVTGFAFPSYNLSSGAFLPYIDFCCAFFDDNLKDPVRGLSNLLFRDSTYSKYSDYCDTIRQYYTYYLALQMSPKYYTAYVSAGKFGLKESYGFSDNDALKTMLERHFNYSYGDALAFKSQVERFDNNVLLPCDTKLNYYYENLGYRFPNAVTVSVSDVDTGTVYSQSYPFILPAIRRQAAE